MERSTKVVTGLATAAAAVSGSGMLSNHAAEAAVVLAPFTYPIAIPANGTGVYVNINTLTTSTTGSFAGYDINLYSQTAGQAFFTSSTSNATATNRGVVALTTTGSAFNFAATGGTVGPGSTYNTGVSGATAGLFPPGSTAEVGFRYFQESDSTLHYAYAVFTPASGTTAPTTAGAISAIYYESDAGVAITVPAVPEPTSLGLLAAGSLGLLRRRNKVA
jgi:hypothetical protein